MAGTSSGAKDVLIVGRQAYFSMGHAICKAMQAAIAVLVCSFGISAQTAPLAANEAVGYLSLQNTYHTDCIGLFGTPFVDGHFSYYSKGFFKKNYFSKLDLLTGLCTKVTSIPSPEFKPYTASNKFLVAEDGIYSRFSVYSKADWSRHGTMRLRDSVDAAAISGDTLFLVQDRNNSTDSIVHTSLNIFSLPSFRYQKSLSLGLDGYNPHKAFAFSTSFLLYDDEGLTSYNYKTGVIDRKKMPLEFSGTIVHRGGYKQSVFCIADVSRVDDQTALVRNGCHSYALFNLADLTPRYTVRLAADGVFARGFHVGTLLYVFQPIRTGNPSSGGETDHVQVLNYATGDVIAYLPPLISNGETKNIVIGDKLVHAVFSQATNDFFVEVYAMRSTSAYHQ